MGENNKGIQSPILPIDIYPVECLEAYVSLGSTRFFQKGSVVAMAGEEMQSIAYVLSGHLKIIKVASDGQEKYAYSAQKYSLTGRLFPTTRSDILIVAQEDSRVCFFSKEQIAEVFRHDESVIFEIIKNYHAKVSYFMNQVVESHLYTPRVRVIRMFWEMFCSNGYLADGEYIIKLNLSQKSISEITGAHYVTVSRLMKFLKEEKVLEKRDGKIVVKDPARLMQLAAEEYINYYPPSGMPFPRP